MTDQNVRAELKKLGITVGLIMVIYVAIYIVESKTQFLIKMLS